MKKNETQHSQTVNDTISKITSKIRRYERETKAAQEYAEAVKRSSALNSFNFASRIIDMYQSRDWGGNLTPGKKLLLNEFMSSAQEAEKFRMDQINWSKKAINDNLHCIEKHTKEGLGLLPFNKILFQTRFYNSPNVIYLNLFEYKNKDIENNTIEYNYSLVKIKKNSLCYNKLNKITITVPIDFSKDKIRCLSKKSVAIKSFLQLNSHTDKNTNLGIHDIQAKQDTGIGSFKIQDNKEDKKDFIPVWKSKTVHIKPDQYKAERDTTYTSDVSDESSPEKRFIPYHSVRGHIRRLRKGDITAVRSHFRGQKEYGAIHKNYVLAPPRILRKNKVI